MHCRVDKGKPDQEEGDVIGPPYSNLSRAQEKVDSRDDHDRRQPHRKQHCPDRRGQGKVADRRVKRVEQDQAEGNGLEAPMHRLGERYPIGFPRRWFRGTQEGRSPKWAWRSFRSPFTSTTRVLTIVPAASRSPD